MVLDFIKTNELTSISRQLLNSKKELVQTALNTSQNVVIKGVEYNRTVIQAVVNALSSSREETGRLVEQVLEQGRKVEVRALETLEEASDKSIENINGVFDRVGNPASTVGGAVQDSLLDSVQSISEPSVEMLKSVNKQLTEVPGKLLKTAAPSEEKAVKAEKVEKKATVVRKPAPKAESKAAPKAAPKAESKAAPKAAAKDTAKASA